MKLTIKNLFKLKALAFVFAAFFGLSANIVMAQNLNVTLSSDTPRGTNIPYDSSAVSFTTVELTASDDADVQINSMTFTRLLDIGDTNDFGAVWLEINKFKVGNRSSVSSDGKAKIVFSPPMLVPAGQTVVAEVLASLSADSKNIGHFHRFGLISAADVNTSASVNGAFPIEGEEMKIENYQVSQVKLASLKSNFVLDTENNAAEIGSFSLSNNSSTNKDIELLAITLKNNGSASLESDIENLALYMDGDQVSANTVVRDDTVAFVLDNGVTGGYVLENSKTLTFTARASIPSANNKTIKFQAQSLKSIEIGTGFGVKAIDNSGAALSPYEPLMMAANPQTVAVPEKTVSHLQVDYTSKEVLPTAQKEKPVTSKPFSDVSETHKNHKAIKFLKEKEVIKGYEDGSFQADRTVNRAELLKIIVASKGLELSSDEYQNCFPDVTTEWFAPFVCYAKAQGWVKGYPDGTFQPAKTVSKVESLKMLLEAYNEATEEPSEKPFDDIETNHWFAKYVARAKQKGLLEETGKFFSPGEGHRRGGIAENLYRLIK